MSKAAGIGLGTVQFGLPYGVSNSSGQTSFEEAGRILSFARSRNIHLLDTATAYGSAEEVLGQHGVTGFQVVSKFMPPAEAGGEGRDGGEKIQSQLKMSLRNLGLESLYGYLAHRPMDLLARPQLWQELLSLKESGLVKKIGYSLNAPDELKLLLEAGFTPDIVQIPFNYVDRRFAKPASELKKNGCEIHARSVFLQGLFFRKPESLGDHFETIKPVISKLQKTVTNLPGALLHHVLGQPFVDRVIIGVESIQQLRQNLDAIDHLKSATHSEDLPELEVTLPDEILMPQNWPRDPLFTEEQL